MTALHRLVVVDIDNIAETRLKWQPFKGLARFGLAAILDDGDASATYLCVFNFRFDRDTLYHAILLAYLLQLRLGYGFEQAAQEKNAEVSVAYQLLLVEAVQSAEKAIAPLVGLNTKREVTGRQN